MDMDAALNALDRIEFALERIAEVASRTVDVAAPGHDAALHSRHEDLKASVARSLASLDELLADRA